MALDLTGPDEGAHLYLLDKMCSYRTLWKAFMRRTVEVSVDERRVSFPGTVARTNPIAEPAAISTRLAAHV